MLPLPRNRGVTISAAESRLVMVVVRLVSWWQAREPCNWLRMTTSMCLTPLGVGLTFIVTLFLPKSNWLGSILPILALLVRVSV